MNERNLNEFAFLYKRVIRIEKYLKELIVEKYTTFYKEKAYDILFNRYFLTLEKRRSNKDYTFSEIKRKNKNNYEKLSLSVDKMYISEVLSLFNHKAFLKNTVHRNFFSHPIETNKDDFKKIAKLLKDFRNCICHFDEKQFLIEKNRFVESLLFFERLLDCKYQFTSGVIESISHKLSIKAILELIYQYEPESFKDDRILVNIFDDIASIAGYRIDNMPQYWSIIRQKFKVKGTTK